MGPQTRDRKQTGDRHTASHGEHRLSVCLRLCMRSFECVCTLCVCMDLHVKVCVYLHMFVCLFVAVRFTNIPQFPHSSSSEEEEED